MTKRADPTRPRCVHCGKSYGRRDVEELVVDVPMGSPEPPPPASNKRLIKREKFSHLKTPAVPDGLTDSHRFTFWDGESYRVGGSPAPFCTLTCATDYARRMWSKFRYKFPA